MFRLLLSKFWDNAGAVVQHSGAAGMEGAPAGRPQEGRGHARDSPETALGVQVGRLPIRSCV